MTRHQTHAEDTMELLREQLAKGAIDRRRFLQFSAMITGTVAVGGNAAFAQGKEIVLSNAGGDAVAAMGKAWGEPFTKASGVKVTIDGTFPSSAKIKAMVDAKNVTWDVCDRNLASRW